MRMNVGQDYSNCKLKIVHMVTSDSSQFVNAIQLMNTELNYKYKYSENFDSLDSCAMMIFDTNSLAETNDDCRRNRDEYEHELFDVLAPHVIVCWGWARSTNTSSMVKCLCTILDSPVNEAFTPINEYDETFGEIEGRFVFNLYAPDSNNFSTEELKEAACSDKGIPKWLKTLEWRARMKREEEERIAEEERIREERRFIEKEKNAAKRSLFFEMAVWLIVGLIGNVWLFSCLVVVSFLVPPILYGISIIKGKDIAFSVLLQSPKGKVLAVLFAMVEIALVVVAYLCIYSGNVFFRTFFVVLLGLVANLIEITCYNKELEAKKEKPSCNADASALLAWILSSILVKRRPVQ